MKQNIDAMTLTLESIERDYRKALANNHGEAVMLALIGAPFAVGAMAVTLSFVLGSHLDVDGLLYGLGISLALGSATSAIYWAGLRAWARWWPV